MPLVTCESALPGAAVKVFLYPVNEEPEARESYTQKREARTDLVLHNTLTGRASA